MLNEKLAYEELKKQYHYVLMKSEKQKYMPIKEVFVIGKMVLPRLLVHIWKEPH